MWLADDGHKGSDPNPKSGMQMKEIVDMLKKLKLNPIAAKEFFPSSNRRSEDEREMCARTVYCTNSDKKVTQADVKNFFKTRCGEVSRLRFLGDHVHSTRIAFVEFYLAESAIVALDCCGEVLGSQRIRVSPSKTPVRPHSPRPRMQ
ncbi:Polyadenylate-binding protein-interacting protein 9 [Striga hermonthica]|uniref:Polyadenylate-binding protein-interacting protein 9 n=1 Tax=Striga hermonthica TaxID=68872 RepID=A0A9N7RLD2_STRHE|nr:Polyadenylate-binding protein-interacting protein 9 [Striga hermonthica]